MNKFNVVAPTMRAHAEDCEDYFSNTFPVNFVPHHCGNFVIHIDGPIESPIQFRDAVRALENADEDHGVSIHLQSPGGSLSATDYMIHAMRKCQGPIHIIATGNCSSAASLILLEADSFELSEGFSSLLHCGSLGTVGAYNEYKAQTDFNNQFMPGVMRRAYKHFLTEDEIESLIKGVDIWLDGAQWLERWNRREEALAAEMQEAAQQIAEELMAEDEDEEEASYGGTD